MFYPIFIFFHESPSQFCIISNEKVPKIKFQIFWSKQEIDTKSPLQVVRCKHHCRYLVDGNSQFYQLVCTPDDCQHHACPSSPSLLINHMIPTIQCPPTGPSFPLFIISMFQFVDKNIYQVHNTPYNNSYGVYNQPKNVSYVLAKEAQANVARTSTNLTTSNVTHVIIM